MAAAKTTHASDNDVHEAGVSVYIRPPLSQRYDHSISLAWSHSFILKQVKMAPTQQTKPRHIVIVGGGAAGMVCNPLIPSPSPKHWTLTRADH